MLKKIIHFLLSFMLIRDIQNWFSWTTEQKRNFVGFIIGFIGICLAVLTLPAFNGEQQEEKTPYFYQNIETPFGSFCTGKLASMEKELPKYSKALNYLMNYGFDFKDTVSYYNSQKNIRSIFMEAYPEIQAASEKGNQEAIYLDALYHERILNGEDTNASLAIELYKKSNLPCAKLNLANMLMNEKKLDEAFEIYKKLAKEKFPAGISGYANFLQKYPKYNIINNENIADLYKEAANLNDKNAFYHLGLMDIEARPQKLQSAIRSFETCAKLGLAECSTALGDIYATEDNVLSEKYYETAMKSGDTDGMFKYALILIRSDDVNRKEKGKALLKLAGELRNFKAKRVYADLVNDGVIQDDFPGKNTLLFKLYCETWLHGDKESGKILEANFSKDKVEDMCQFYRQTYNASMLFKIQNHIPLNGLEAKYPFLPFGLLFYEDIDLLQITDELKARKK